MPVIIALIAGVLLSGAGFYIYFRLSAKADEQNIGSEKQEAATISKDYGGSSSPTAQTTRTNADENIVLLDNNGVTVCLTGEYNVYNGPDASFIELAAVVINDSDTTVDIGTNFASINGWEIDVGGITRTRPAKKQADNIILWTNSIDISSVNDIDDLELEIVAWDSETYEDVTAVSTVSIGFNDSRLVLLSGGGADTANASDDNAAKDIYETTHDDLAPYLAGLRKGLDEDNSIGLTQEAVDGIDSVQIFDKTGSIVFQTEFKDPDVSRMLGVQPTEKTETMKWVSDDAVSDEDYEHYIDLLCEYYKDDVHSDTWEDLEYYCSVEASHVDGKIQIKWFRQQYTPEEFAARLITSLAGVLPNPLSVNIIGAWFSYDITGYSFTFQLTMENSLGNSQTVYYGTPYGIDDLDDSTIDYTAHLDRDSISAMQEGQAMNADNIQNYFIMNYGRD